MGIACVQDILEDLFLDHEVDMVMSGHVHLYARTCSVKHDRCKKAGRGGITHVTVGTFRLSWPIPWTCLLWSNVDLPASISAGNDIALFASGTGIKQILNCKMYPI